jgi:hypothetical protein
MNQLAVRCKSAHFVIRRRNVAQREGTLRMTTESLSLKDHGPWNIPPSIKGRPVVDVLAEALEALEFAVEHGDEIDGYYDRRTHWGRREAHVATPLWDGYATLEIVGAFNRENNADPLRSLVRSAVEAIRALRGPGLIAPIDRQSDGAVVGAKVRIGRGRAAVKFSRPRLDTLARLCDLDLNGVPALADAPPSYVTPAPETWCEL